MEARMFTFIDSKVFLHQTRKPHYPPCKDDPSIQGKRHGGPRSHCKSSLWTTDGFHTVLYMNIYMPTSHLLQSHCTGRNPLRRDSDHSALRACPLWWPGSTRWNRSTRWRFTYQPLSSEMTDWWLYSPGLPCCLYKSIHWMYCPNKTALVLIHQISAPEEQNKGLV